jgi:hypothetical protein
MAYEVNKWRIDPQRSQKGAHQSKMETSIVERLKLRQFSGIGSWTPFQKLSLLGF